MGKMTLKLKAKESGKTTWKTQARKFTTSKKVDVDFCLPECNALKIMTWKFHVDKSANGRYVVILGRDLPTALGLDPKFFRERHDWPRQTI